MTPAEWYQSRTIAWTLRRDASSRRALRLSRLRLLTFFAGVVVLVAAWRGHSALLAAAGVAAFAAFGWCVVRHAGVLLEIERADAALALARAGLARLARDWTALPDVPPPPDFDGQRHPYARDLDIHGHASLTKWLGPASQRFPPSSAGG